MRTISTVQGSRLRGRFWVMAAVLAACGGDEGGGGDTSAAGDTGASDGTAPDGTAPDPDATSPGEVVASFCRDDGECTGPGEICDCHGQCVVAGGTPCTEDRNCGVPRWCNTCTGFCEEQVGVCAPCEEARACLDLGACLPYSAGGTYCGLGCVTAAGCPQGFDCVAVPGVEAKQCVARSGACEDLGLCERDGECPLGQICSDATRTCTAGCAEDGQCQNGLVCVLGRCVPPCGGDGDCNPPATCQAGKCKIPGACEVANDCPDPETYCSRESGSCEPGCQIDDDCKDAAKRCDGGQCVAKGCLHNFECAHGRVCDQASGSCVPFPASEPHCATCNAEAEQNASCPDPNVCVRFQGDEEGEVLGDFCLVPCKDDPIDRCPSGWQCTEVQDQQSGTSQFFCVRQCYIDPVGGGSP